MKYNKAHFTGQVKKANTFHGTRKVSKLSYTSDIFEGKPYPIDGEDVPAEAWFKGSYNLKNDERVNEFNIPMKNYNSVLTVLWEE
jgi:hypothetical protein